MTNIRINETKRAIEVTKAFANKASIYGTDEYNELQAVRKDYPGFKVVSKNDGKRSGTFKGLTIEYMKSYISTHNEENMKDFNTLCGLDENGEKLEFAGTATYGEIKKWFLKKYPVFNEYTKKIDEILKSA